jgi:hypothetical protein
MAIMQAQGVTESDGEVYKVHERGIYPAEIISAEWKEVNPDGDSAWAGAAYLALGIKVTNPENEVSVTCRDMFFLPNPEIMDADGVRKSLAKFKMLQIATDTEDMGDDIDNDVFLHLECQVEVSKKDDKQYGLQNEVRDYLPL